MVNIETHLYKLININVMMTIAVYSVWSGKWNLKITDNWKAVVASAIADVIADTHQEHFTLV